MWFLSKLLSDGFQFLCRENVVDSTTASVFHLTFWNLQNEPTAFAEHTAQLLSA
jgi:hypothetical protein